MIKVQRDGRIITCINIFSKNESMYVLCNDLTIWYQNSRHSLSVINFSNIFEILILGLEELDDLDVLTGVDVGGAEGGEEDKLELSITLSVVEDVVDSNLKQNL